MSMARRFGRGHHQAVDVKSFAAAFAVGVLRKPAVVVTGLDATASPSASLAPDRAQYAVCRTVLVVLKLY